MPSAAMMEPTSITFTPLSSGWRLTNWYPVYGLLV
jgi:hypothetical protein